MPFPALLLAVTPPKFDSRPLVTPPANRANWKLADRFTSEAVRPYLYSTSLTPGWINKTDQFWYSWRTAEGVKFWRVDAGAHSKEPLFDTAKMAALLSELSKKPYDTTNLPITTITFDEKNDRILRFTVEQARYEYDCDKETLKKVEATPEVPTTPPAGAGQGRGGGQRGGGFGQAGGDFRNYSPDKKSYVYAQDCNLFYVEVVDGKEKPAVALTTDGERYFSFGSRQEQDERREQQRILNAGQTQTTEPPVSAAASSEKRVRASVTWSPDSKRFFVVRRDERKVGDLFLVNSLVTPRPGLLTYRYTMPGETEVTQSLVYGFDLTTKKLTRLPVEKYKDATYSNFHFQDNAPDKLRFVRRDRLQRNLEFCEMDLKTQKVTALITESVENASLEVQQVRYVKPGGDMIWWSERSGWGHFYLYSNDGKLKNAITSGPYRADELVAVDDKENAFWFKGVGRERGENPYYHHLYRASLDGKSTTLLDEGDADHSSSTSDDHRWVVDVCSRTDMEPSVCLRDGRGRLLMNLEKADLSRLKETGWMMPETFKVKAADGVTDIYGNMWKPFDFDPKKKYPVIANVYPGPQTESVSTTFSAVSTNTRLAQLGFIVIQIGNRGGNPDRSNAYQNFGYFNLRDYGLADKKAGIEQLAQKHAWIDIEQVGIYGHSGGGFMTAAALMLPPYNTFFKCGVSSSGNHDNNVYNQNWSEQYHGLREVPVTSTANARPDAEEPVFSFGFPDEPQFIGGQGSATNFQIKVPTNAELAANLKNNLLLVHGDMDNNVHPAGTVRLINALIRANKRFDYVLIPGKQHGYADMQGYFTNRLMEYFSEHLLGDRRPSKADMDDHG